MAPEGTMGPSLCFHRLVGNGLTGVYDDAVPPVALRSVQAGVGADEALLGAFASLHGCHPN